MFIRTVGAIIENGDKKFLLQLRDNNAPSYRNKWLLFGGHAEGDETPIETVIRELNEELGLDFTEDRFTYLEKIIFVNESQNQVESFLFKLFIRPEEKIKLGEGTSYKFFTKEEALLLPIPNVMEEIIKKHFV